MDFAAVLSRVPLPGQGSNRGYQPEQLILNFLVGVWCGANCFDHLEVTRHDEVIKDIFDWKRMPGSLVFLRYFNKFDLCINQDVFTYVYQWFFRNLHFDNCTIDFHSTILKVWNIQLVNHRLGFS